MPHTVQAVDHLLRAHCGTCSAATPERHTSPAPSLPIPANRFRKIMVAIEHDHHPALNAGLSLANNLGAQLAIITVADLSFATQAVYAYGSADTLRELRAFSFNLLQSFQRTLPPSFSVDLFNPEANPGEKIIAYAKSWQADLLILGTHRRGNIAALLLGSTSRYAVKHAPCPVMLVPDLAPRPQTS